MNWLNTPTNIIHAPEYVGSEPTQRATWWNLMVYCATQENGGIVHQCRGWKCRRWQQTCGVTFEEVGDDCDLWSWDGDNLVIWGYPGEKENEVKAKRKGGSIGGKRRAEKEASNSASNSSSSIALSSASTERNGKERNGKEVALATAPTSEREKIYFPDFTPEPNGKHPPEAETNINALADKVRSLRPEWKKMALTYAEMRSLTECAASLEGLDADDWESIRRYLAAKLPEGTGGWQPRSRAKFLESAPDVYSHAAQWAAKNKPTSTQPRTGGWK